MLGLLNYVQLGAGAVVGAVLAVLVGTAYDAWIDDPAVRRETTAQVEAEAFENTVKAINEVTGNADKARALRRYCDSVGGVYSFSRNECKQD